MDWVKLSTRYYNDPALARAGEAAEILFTRGLAYAGEQETDGVVPREVLPRLVTTKATARVRALVREGLWEVIPEGWRFTSWDRHQATREDLERHRAANRNRQARHRRRNGTSNAVRNAVTNAEVTPTEVEEELEDAAAAASVTPPTPLPGTLEVLRTKLEARNLRVRWDKLTLEQLVEISDLIDTHGDAPLVDAALRSYRPDSPPAFAQAWLGTWRALPAPGRRLQAVTDPACPERGHTGTTRHCAQCASERLAGDRR